MTGNPTPAGNNGIGLATVLGLIFVTLKLCGVIDWSWWWVTLPFWGFLALLGVIFVGGTIVILLHDVMGKLVKKHNGKGW